MESQQQQQEENKNNNNNKKKTRDLPNLSECHSCGYRIDSCNNDMNNNNNRLQTLYSEWRIVLLCRICFFRVESSILCAYCFKGSSSSGDDDDDNCFFNCRQCKHIIHKSCFSKYSNVAPWSFSSKFSVCVDCWVPKSIASKRACSRSKKRNSNSKCNLLEDVVRDANFDVQRKVEAAARARELAVEKALAARMAAQLSHNALELVSESDVNHKASVEDVQFVVRLHRALNSSPRILNNLSSLSSADSSPLVRTDVCRKLDVSHGVKPAANPSVSVRVSAYDSSLIMDSLGSKGIDDSWARLNAIESDIQLKEGEGSCSDKLMNSKSQSCRLQNGSAVLANERCNGKPDRYSRKYTRRTSPDETCNGKPDRYSIKYTRRTSADKRYNRKPDLYLRKYARRTSAYARYYGKVDGYLRKYTRRKTTADERYNGKPDRNAIKYTYTRRRKNQRSALALCSNCLYDRLNMQPKLCSWTNAELFQGISNNL